MKKDVLVISFFIIWALIIVSFIFKYLGDSITQFRLTLLIFLMDLIFIYLVIKEVAKSNKIERHEKRMWIIGMIFMSTVLGWIYIFSARKRVVESNSQHNY